MSASGAWMRQVCTTTVTTERSRSSLGLLRLRSPSPRARRPPLALCLLLEPPRLARPAARRVLAAAARARCFTPRPHSASTPRAVGCTRGRSRGRCARAPSKQPRALSPISLRRERARGAGADRQGRSGRAHARPRGSQSGDAGVGALGDDARPHHLVRGGRAATRRRRRGRRRPSSVALVGQPLIHAARSVVVLHVHVVGRRRRRRAPRATACRVRAVVRSSRPARRRRRRRRRAELLERGERSRRTTLVDDRREVSIGRWTA